MCDNSIFSLHICPVRFSGFFSQMNAPHCFGFWRIIMIMTNPFSKMMKASVMNDNPFMVCPQFFQQVKIRGIRKHYEAMHPGKDLPKARVKSNVSKTRLVFAKSTNPKKPACKG